MKIIGPPRALPPGNNSLSLFLAGSIDMGSAPDWQAAVIDLLHDRDITLLNPRRASWWPETRQSRDNPDFRGQVDWEQDHLAAADRVLFYFAEQSFAPITLMELGVCCGSARRKASDMVVYCPPGFYRKGNVDIVCERRGVRVFEKEEALFNFLRNSDFLNS